MGFFFFLETLDFIITPAILFAVLFNLLSSVFSGYLNLSFFKSSISISVLSNNFSKLSISFENLFDDFLDPNHFTRSC
jgi:hypothetical protein